jgi:hypothetical protein
MCIARQPRYEMRTRTLSTGVAITGGDTEVAKVIRNVFSRIGHVLETNLVDPKEQYQASLLGDSVARHAHDGDYASRGKIRTPHLVGEERATASLKKAA